MKGIWNNNEVKELFSVVESYKEKNKSLKLAFALHAQKFGRKPNSVRNYYYHEVDNLKLDSKRLKKLGIDLNLHDKMSIVYFTQEEEARLMQEIDEMVGRGMSVRKACLTLSGGDINQMLRCQNKYRNYLAKQKKEMENEKGEVVKEVKADITNSNNVITFKKIQKSLTDGEVQALFMGLVKLVKKNALEESDNLYRTKLNEANDALRLAFTKISSRERELDKLKEEIIKLKKENSNLSNMAMKLKCELAENINSNR